jgi:hypothetical protein
MWSACALVVVCLCPCCDHLMPMATAFFAATHTHACCQSVGDCFRAGCLWGAVFRVEGSYNCYSSAAAPRAGTTGWGCLTTLVYCCTGLEYVRSVSLYLAGFNPAHSAAVCGVCSLYPADPAAGLCVHQWAAAGLQVLAHMTAQEPEAGLVGFGGQREGGAPRSRLCSVVCRVFCLSVKCMCQVFSVCVKCFSAAADLFQAGFAECLVCSLVSCVTTVHTCAVHATSATAKRSRVATHCTACLRGLQLTNCVCAVRTADN